MKSQWKNKRNVSTNHKLIYFNIIYGYYYAVGKIKQYKYLKKQDEKKTIFIIYNNIGLFIMLSCITLKQEYICMCLIVKIAV